MEETLFLIKIGKERKQYIISLLFITVHKTLTGTIKEEKEIK